MKDKIHLAWIYTILAVTLILSMIAFLVIFHDWSYTLKFEMDNNTLEAVKTINWTTIKDIQEPKDDSLDWLNRTFDSYNNKTMFIYANMGNGTVLNYSQTQIMLDAYNRGEIK